MFGVSSEEVAPATLGSFFFLAAYLNLNDPDWALWSTAYGLGALICVWTALRGGGGGGGGAATAAGGAVKDVSRTRRRVAMAYGAACLGLAGYSTFLAPRGSPSKATDESTGGGIILSFLSSEVAREAGGALIMVQAMALCASSGKPSDGNPAAAVATAGEGVVRVLSVAVAVASIALGLLLPGYLQRAGIAVPAHCGGE